MIKRIFVSILLVGCLANCASGTSANDTSPARIEDSPVKAKEDPRVSDTTVIKDGMVSLNALGGKPVIVGDQKQRVTRVSGKIWIGKGASKTLAPEVKVQIIKDKTIFVEGLTDAKGEFKLFEVMPNGGYTLRAKFKNSKLDTPITVSGYEVSNLEIQLDQ